jgi:hypothetical protein
MEEEREEKVSFEMEEEVQRALPEGQGGMFPQGREEKVVFKSNTGSAVTFATVNNIFNIHQALVFPPRPPSFSLPLRNSVGDTLRSVLKVINDTSYYCGDFFDFTIDPIGLGGQGKIYEVPGYYVSAASLSQTREGFRPWKCRVVVKKMTVQEEIESGSEIRIRLDQYGRQFPLPVVYDDDNFLPSTTDYSHLNENIHFTSEGLSEILAISRITVFYDMGMCPVFNKCFGVYKCSSYLSGQASSAASFAGSTILPTPEYNLIIEKADTTLETFLYELLKDTKTGIEELKKILGNIVTAILFLNRIGIYHADLHLGNVMLIDLTKTKYCYNGKRLRPNTMLKYIYAIDNEEKKLFFHNVPIGRYLPKIIDYGGTVIKLPDGTIFSSEFLLYAQDTIKFVKINANIDVYKWSMLGEFISSFLLQIVKVMSINYGVSQEEIVRDLSDSNRNASRGEIEIFSRELFRFLKIFMGGSAMGRIFDGSARAETMLRIFLNKDYMYSRFAIYPGMNEVTIIQFIVSLYDPQIQVQDEIQCFLPGSQSYNKARFKNPLNKWYEASLYPSGVGKAEFLPDAIEQIPPFGCKPSIDNLPFGRRMRDDDGCIVLKHRPLIKRFDYTPKDFGIHKREFKYDQQNHVLWNDDNPDTNGYIENIIVFTVYTENCVLSSTPGGDSIFNYVLYRSKPPVAAASVIGLKEPPLAAVNGAYFIVPSNVENSPYPDIGKTNEIKERMGRPIGFFYSRVNPVWNGIALDIPFTYRDDFRLISFKHGKAFYEKGALSKLYSDSHNKGTHENVRYWTLRDSDFVEEIFEMPSMDVNMCLNYVNREGIESCFCTGPVLIEDRRIVLTKARILKEKHVINILGRGNTIISILDPKLRRFPALRDRAPEPAPVAALEATFEDHDTYSEYISRKFLSYKTEPACPYGQKTSYNLLIHNVMCFDEKGEVTFVLVQGRGFDSPGLDRFQVSVLIQTILPETVNAIALDGGFSADCVYIKNGMTRHVMQTDGRRLGGIIVIS